MARVDIENHDFDLLADLRELRRMSDLARPRHLGDMDQSFDAALELDERAVVHDADHFALHPGADAVFLRHGVPGVGGELLHAEGDALLFGVELEHHDLDGFADLDDLRRMADPSPRHIADVQNAVDAAEIDEGAVAGDVLDCALEDHALLENFEDLLLELVPLLLQERAARDHDVAAARG